MQFWIPVVSKWTTQKEYRTLADVPERIDCVVVNSQGNPSDRLVRCRKGSSAFLSSTHTVKLDPASRYLIDKVLDPIPDPSTTLDDLPDGRCFSTSGYPGTIRWKHGGSVYRVLNGSGLNYAIAKEFNTDTAITVLDLEMQLQDVPVTVSK